MDNWMFVVNFVMNLFTWAIILVVGFLLRNYLPTYFQEKGKNLATKEDIEEITDKIERIRSQYALDQEKLKTELQEESEMLARRRDLYDNVVKSLSIFLSGRAVTEEQKARFLDGYSTLWLWAPDSVVRSLKDFLDLEIAAAQKPGSVDQEALRRAYTSCVLEMRRSSGFPDTTLSHDDYRFVYF